MLNPKVSIIIPLYNQAGFTRLCLEYVEKNTPAGVHEVILVDNASSDATVSLVAGLPPAIKRIRNTVNLGFSKACNQGAAIAAGEYLVFLNNDTAPHAGWLEALLEPLGRYGDIGIVGPKLLFPDGTIQQAGVVFSNLKLPHHLYSGCAGDFPGADRERFFQAVTAACFMVSKADFEAAGRFDERYVNGMEDMHFCVSVAKLGKRILYNPASRVTHFESRSENRQEAMDANIRLFLDECAARVAHDDFRYLLDDGMDFWVGRGRFSFLSKAEGDAKAKEYLAAAGECVRQGNLEKAQGIYQDLLNRNPYNCSTLLAISEVMERFGVDESAVRLKDLARQLSIGFQERPARG